MGSLVAMLGCCLPLPAMLAATSLGAAAGWLPAARPYLLACSIGCLAFAFYRLYHRRYCDARRPLWLQAMVWIALMAVGVSTFLPQWTANLLAGPVAAAPARPRGSQPPLVVLRELGALRESFNAAAGQTRLIALLSPT